MGVGRLGCEWEEFIFCLRSVILGCRDVFSFFDGVVFRVGGCRVCFTFVFSERFVTFIS